MPEPDREAVKVMANEAVQAGASLPIPFIVRNVSSSGIRNLYIEMEFSALTASVELSQSAFSPRAKGVWMRDYTFYLSHLFEDDIDQSSAHKNLQMDLEKYDADKLQKVDAGWRLSLEWEALQPQRTRLVKPVIYAYCPESTQLKIRARIFADSFPEPVELEIVLNINVSVRETSLDELLPRWKELLERDKRGKIAAQSARA